MTNKLTDALNNDDLDAALAPLQDALGIETGDVAAAAFSGLDDGEWALLDRRDRIDWISTWIKMELLHAD